MSVSEFQSYLLKYKKGLAVFVSLALLLCAGYINTKQSYTAETFIKYLGENAEQGLTPAGSGLNPFEISDALIVKKALESIGVGSTNYNSIRKKISISPVELYSEQAKYASYIDNFSNYNNTEEKKAHPVFYSVKFTTGESAEFARTFLDALVEQYRIYYVEKYAYSDDITLLSEKAVMQYDYFETANILEDKLRSNISYLKDIASSDTDFRSAQTGYSMSDLAAEYDAILQNDLANVSRFIIENGLSKNSAVLKKAFENRAESSVLESNKYSDRADAQKSLLETYSKKNKEYVWNHSHIEDEYQIVSDTERDYIYNTDKSVYDQMILNYTNYRIKSKDLLIDNDVYNIFINYFPDESVQDPVIEQMLSEICAKYNKVQQLTETTISDYNNFKSSRYLANVSGIATVENVNNIVYYASALVLSLGFGIIFIVFLELKRKKEI